jgi:inorganic pyrophosphatase/exopolyphosphatase
MALKQFLQESKTVFSLAVLGNTSADLDSVVGSITLAYYLHKVRYSQHKHLAVTPVINSLRDDLPLRLEVAKALSDEGLEFEDLLVFSDIDWTDKQIVLFDHNSMNPSQT